MGSWKGKKRQTEQKKLLVCPNCMQPCLSYASQISGLFAAPKYQCNCCGYKGSVYLDVSGDDKKENETLKIFAEEFPDDMIETKSASELACETLKSKWTPNQKENENLLRDWCPFCADIQVNCSICKCPKKICAHHATEGFIGKLNENYSDNTPLKDVDPELYGKIVKGFTDLCGKKNK